MTEFVIKLPNWLVFLVLLTGVILGHPLRYGAFLFLVPYLVWLYSLWHQSHIRIPANANVSTKKPLAAIVFAGTYMLIASRFFYAIMPYAIPFHLLAMYCIFYVLYYVAKSLRTADLGREAKFEDSFALFFGLWFFPIGVWFIQKKAQKVMTKTDQK